MTALFLSFQMCLPLISYSSFIAGLGPLTETSEVLEMLYFFIWCHALVSSFCGNLPSRKLDVKSLISFFLEDKENSAL